MEGDLQQLQRILHEALGILCRGDESEKYFEVDAFVQKLKEKNALKSDDVETIKRKETNTLRVDAMIDILCLKPQSAYVCFMEVLQLERKDLYTKVKEIQDTYNYEPSMTERRHHMNGESSLATEAKEKMQLRTLSRWCNNHLDVGQHFEDLQEEFWDGTKLNTLVETLLQKGNKDTADGKRKVVLRFMRQLIQEHSALGDKEQKKALLTWIQEKIPSLEITNLTTDWNDGRALGSLVNTLAEGACPDWSDWNEKDAKRNISEAMTMAEDWLKVVQLVTPHEMMTSDVSEISEISMMIYLEQFVKSSAKMLAVTVPKRPDKLVIKDSNATELTVKWDAAGPAQVNHRANYNVEYLKVKLPVDTWKQCDDVISETTYVVQKLENYQEYRFCVRGLYETQHGPLSTLSKVAVPHPKLKNEQKTSILIKSSEFLCQYLDPSQIVISLTTKHHLKPKDKHEIRHPPAISDRVDRLLTILQRKENKAYFAFMAALRKERPDLFKFIINIECACTSGKPMEHLKADLNTVPKVTVEKEGQNKKAVLDYRATNKMQDPSDDSTERVGRPASKGEADDSHQPIDSIAPAKKAEPEDEMQDRQDDDTERVGRTVSNKAAGNSHQPYDSTVADINIEIGYQDTSDPPKKLQGLDNTIFEHLRQPQVLSNIVNNVFTPLGCRLSQFKTTGTSGTLEFVVQCRNVADLLKLHNTLADQIEGLVLTVEVTEEETMRVSIKTNIDEGAYQKAREHLIKSDLPGLPSNLKAANINKTTISISWTPPANTGGSPVTGYMIEMCDVSPDVSQEQWSKVNDRKVSETDYKIDTLKAGKKYKFRASAENDAGRSEPSIATDEITAKELFDPPSRPGKPVVEIMSNYGIELQWTPPEHDGGFLVTGYTIEKNDMISPGKWIKVNKEKVTSSKYIITDFSAGNQLKFRVKAYNPAGNSEPSEPSDVVTLCDLPVPSKPKVANINETTIKITWAPPTHTCRFPPEICFPVTGYVIEKSDVSKEEWSRINKVTETDCRIAGLKPGKQYQFRVLAENIAGIGKPSQATDVISAKEPLDPPSRPGKPKVMCNSGIELQWTPPENDGGFLVTGYTIEKNDISLGSLGKWIKVNKEKVTSSKYIITDFSAGDKLKFRVLARNPAGDSIPSELSDVVTLCDLPVPSKPKVANINETTIKITWAPLTHTCRFPHEICFPVTGYVIEKSDVSEGEWSRVNQVTETNCRIACLKPGKQYQFRVLAENIATCRSGEPSKATDVITAKEPFDITASSWVLDSVIKDDKLETPGGIACDVNAGICVADWGEGKACVHVYNGHGVYQRALDLGEGLDNRDKSEPHGVVIIGTTCYVTDQTAYVRVFDSIDGAYKMRWLTVKPGDSVDNEEAMLCGIDRCEAGNLFVGTFGNEPYISKHMQDGTHINSFYVNITPIYLAVTTHDTVVISDSSNSHVVIADQSGNTLHSVQYPGMSSPRGVHCHGNVILVCDLNSANIACVNMLGKYMRCIATDTSQYEDGEDKGCRCVCVNEDENTLYVSRGYGNGEINPGRVEAYVHKT